ncbi:MAG: FAD-dependent oxidoreductase [Solirubrobacteraceae bacterium]
MSARVAIVGSGPSGAYAAGHLLRHSAPELHVDLFERLPTPWGLVRAGVAPDHPKIKSVTRVYERTAAHPRARYFGNVEFGKHLTRADLLGHYDAVIYAVGTPTDRPLAIPGEDLNGSHAAVDFVGWYNGHPDHGSWEFDLGVERAVVIGNGNVALDVARMLTLSHHELSLTDIADHALDALEHSRIREILVVGRRGPEQAAFTNPELLELGELEDADVVVDPDELAVADRLPDPSASTTAKRNLEVLRGYAARPLSGRRRKISLHFLQSPVELVGDGRVEAITLERNELAAAPDGALRARGTGAESTISAGLVMRAIGYRGSALPDVPFDERSGLIPNSSGRVTGAPGEYVVGWIKRGPSGVIGTNKKDAQETVDALLEDLAAGRLPVAREPLDDASLERLVHERQPNAVTYAEWVEIDEHERGLGEPTGRPRVKLTTIESMLGARRRD